MNDNIITFGSKSTETIIKEQVPLGPQSRTFNVRTIEGEDIQATGALITTSVFVAIGTHTEDGMGVDFEAYFPVSQVKRVTRVAEA